MTEPITRPDGQGPPSLFVSVFAYVLGKETSGEIGEALRSEILAGEGASWPGFRTLARVRAQVHPVMLFVNHSSLIAKARSMALGAFLESGAARWLSIDDDIDASAEDVARMLRAEDVDVLIGPCALRGGANPTLNILTKERVTPEHVRTLNDAIRVVSVEYGGLALSVVTRHAAERLAFAHPSLFFRDDQDGRRGLGVFLEEVRDGHWFGEDFSFCRRARGCGLRVDALCDTAITHAGLTATIDPRAVS
jgi:hypothetical protein